MSACAACARCWRTASRCRWCVTHDDAPGENIWFDSVAATRAGTASRCMTPEDPERARSRRAGARAAAGFPVLVLLPLDARRRAAGAAARAAPTTCTARCCRNIAAACRSTGRCCTASARPAPRCMPWSRKPDAGDIVAQRGGADPAGRHRAGGVSQGHGGGRAGAGSRLPALIAGTARAPAAGSCGGQLLRPPHARATAPSTGARGARAAHNLIRAVAPPYPGAFTRGRRHAAAHPALAARGEPSLRAEPPLLRWRDGDVYALCHDGALKTAAVRARRRSIAQRRGVPSPLRRARAAARARSWSETA